MISLKLAVVTKSLDLYVAGQDLILLKTLERFQVSFLYSQLLGI